MPPQPRPSPLWQRLLLMVLSPVVFIALAEAVVRLSGVETDLARNERFEIAVPVWLLADPGWVQVQHERLQRPKGVRAADVAWLRYFEEARYIQYRLEPRIDVQAVNPFNEIEVARGASFRLRSNERGFRARVPAGSSPDGPAAGPEAGPPPPSAPATDAGRAGVPAGGPRPRRVLRIVTFGDSSTFGWGVDDEYTFQAQLEVRLRQRGFAAEADNFGMPGFTSRHGLAVQRYDAADLEPDVVIVSFGANDGRFGLQTADEALDADETRLAALAWQLRRLESFKLLRRAIFSIYDPFAGLGGEGAAARPQVASVPLPDYRNNLQRMAGLARQRGAEVVFLAVCAPDEYREAMIALGRQRDIPVVDAGALFLERLEDLRDGRLYPDDVAYYRGLYGEDALEENWRYYVTTDGCHPNRAGHRIIADALAGAVEAVVAPRDPAGWR
jgi:lysophospholipase L1-like esterase